MKGKKLIMDCCFKSYKEFEEAYNEINVISLVSRNQSFFKEAHKFINDNIIELPYSCDIFIEDVTGPAGTVKELPGNHAPKLKTSVLDKIWQFIVKCWNSIGKFFNIIIKLVKNIAGNTEKLLARFDKVCELLSDKFGKNTAKMQECFRKSDEKTEQAIYDSIAEEYKSLFGNTEAIAPNLKPELNEAVKIITSKKSSKDKLANPNAAGAINMVSTLTLRIRLTEYLNALLASINIFYLASKGSIRVGANGTQISSADIQSLKSLAIEYKSALMEYHDVWKKSIYNKHTFFILITKNIEAEIEKFEQGSKSLSDKANSAGKKLFQALSKVNLPCYLDPDSKLLEIGEKIKLLYDDKHDFLDIASEIYKILVSLWYEIYNNNKKNPNPNVTALIDIFSQPITALSGASTEISGKLSKKVNDCKSLINITNKLSTELVKIEKEPIKDTEEDPVKDAEITGFTPYEDDEQKQIRGPKGPKALLGEPNLAVTKYKKPGPIVKHKPEEGGPVVKVEDKVKKPKGGIINILIVTIKESYTNIIMYLKTHKILNISLYSLFITGIVVAISIVVGNAGWHLLQGIASTSGTIASLQSLGKGSLDAINAGLTNHPFMREMAMQYRNIQGAVKPLAEVVKGMASSVGKSGDYLGLYFPLYMKHFATFVKECWQNGGGLAAGLGALTLGSNMSKLFKAIQFWKKG